MYQVFILKQRILANNPPAFPVRETRTVAAKI